MFTKIPMVLSVPLLGRTHRCTMRRSFYNQREGSISDADSPLQGSSLKAFQQVLVVIRECIPFNSKSLALRPDLNYFIRQITGDSDLYQCRRKIAPVFRLTCPIRQVQAYQTGMKWLADITWSS